MIGATVFLIGLGAAPAWGQFTNVINLPGDPVPTQIGGVAGQTTQLNIFNGGAVGDSFQANFGSEVNLFGGGVGANFSTSGSVVNVTGGVVGHSVKLDDGSVGTISGGSFGDFFVVDTDSVVHISGGTFGEDFFADDGGVANITGGVFGDYFTVDGLSVANISGGTFGDSFGSVGSGVANISGGVFNGHFGIGGGGGSHPGGTVNLFGSGFEIDGVAIPGLVPGEAFTVTQRGVTLDGVLANGTPISLDVASVFGNGDYFPPGSTLTVTLGGPPSAPVGDYNADGFVSQADLDLVLLNWGDTVAPAGLNQANLPGGGPFDGLVGQNELDGVLLNWGDGTPGSTPPAPGSTAVPEPTSLALLSLGCAALIRRPAVTARV